MDGNVERIIKRVFYLKSEKEISKDNLHKKKSFFGKSNRASDYAQAIMEIGALICKPTTPLCHDCPINKYCLAYKKKDFDIKSKNKFTKIKYFEADIYTSKNKFLLIKNNKFNFLKNLNIFPMDQLNNPKNFDKDLNFKISNMNMNIKIEYKKKHNFDKNINWINPAKLENYVLPTFTKKIIKFLESQK